MARSKETFGKKEVRNKKAKKRKEKEARKLDRKDQGKKSFDDMIAWVDENGQIVDTQPDLENKEEINIESIEIAVPKAEFRVNNRIKNGMVKSFDDSKGFGFIQEQNTRETIFVHINDCSADIAVGMRVEYETEKGMKGMKAVRVKPI